MTQREIVRVEGLVKDFRPGFGLRRKRVLDGITLSVREGEIFGFVGPNGAGKTTTLKVLLGLIRPTAGHAEVLGHPVRETAFRRHIGFLPENPSFYEFLTGREFLRFYARLSGVERHRRDERVELLLAWVGLAHAAGARLRTYSKGMLQRLGIAQALVHDPSVVFLDEPMSGLDPLGKRKLIRLIKDFKSEGRTILVSSHVLPEIEALTSRVVLVHQGKILAQGDVPYIRELIEAHPHQISVRSSDPRALAARFVGDRSIPKMTFGEDGRTLVVETYKRDDFFGRLAGVVLEAGIEVEEISSPDDNLQAVFEYLVGK